MARPRRSPPARPRRSSPARPRRSPPESISQLLPKLLGELGLGDTSRAVRLLQLWDGAVGPEIAPHCRCEGLRRGVVHANVRDSAWMQRIQLESPRILANIAEELGGEAPLSLRLRIGPL